MIKVIKEEKVTDNKAILEYKIFFCGLLIFNYLLTTSNSSIVKSLTEIKKVEVTGFNYENKN